MRGFKRVLLVAGASVTGIPAVVGIFAGVVLILATFIVGALLVALLGLVVAIIGLLIVICCLPVIVWCALFDDTNFKFSKKQVKAAGLN